MFKKQKINDSEVMKYGFLGGMAQAVYCLFVVLFINMLGANLPKPDNELIAPLLALVLFVFSASVSGILVLGYPGYLAIQKKYTEALMTLCTTLATLAIIVILLFLLASLI